MASTSRTRAIWTTAVRRMCTRNGIFRATHDLDAMSLLELEHAATAPSRFIRLMRKYDLVANTTDERLSPMAKQLLHLRLPRKPGAVPALRDSFQDLQLVPGGRFLFTLSQDYFHIWDLGRNAYSGLKPLPLYVKAIEDILDIQSDRVRLPATLLLYHAEAADRILFSIYCRHAFGDDARSVVRVFDAELPDATSAKAVVHRVAQLEYNISVRPTAINDVHVILAGSDTDTEFQHDRMIVWDYRTDALASLKAEKHDQALVFGESIAVPHSLDLSVYRMPALVHSLHTGPAPSRAADVHHAPDQFAVNVTAAADSRALAWSIPKPWFCDPVAPPTLDLFTTTTFHRFSMAKIAVPPAATQALPDHVPYVSAQIVIDLLGEKLTDTYLRSSPCEDHTSFLFTLSHPMDVCCLMYRATSDGTMSVIVPLTTDTRLIARTYDFCPVSGRLCFLCEGKESEGDLRVWDFLVPDHAL